MKTDLRAVLAIALANIDVVDPAIDRLSDNRALGITSISLVPDVVGSIGFAVAVKAAPLQLEIGSGTNARREHGGDLLSIGHIETEPVLVVRRVHRGGVVHARRNRTGGCEWRVVWLVWVGLRQCRRTAPISAIEVLNATSAVVHRPRDIRVRALLL